MTPRRWFEAPLAVQTMVLLVVGTALGQAVAFGVVLFMPPPPPAMYRLDEIATALNGGSLQSRYGRRLIRVVSRHPPSVDSDPHRFDERGRRILARRLKSPLSDVRLDIREDFRQVLRRARRGDAQGPGGPGDPGPPGGPGPSMGQGWPPPGERWEPRPQPRSSDGDARPGVAAMRREWSRGGYGMPIVGDFVAARRAADGEGWVLVRPTPEPFPNAWQRRVMLWFAACLLFLAPAGYLFARRVTAPLAAFAKAADRLGRNPNGPEIALAGPAEIGVAAGAFNDMQVRLKRYLQHRNMMMGAISHDLRGPLTRLRFKMERASPETRDSVLPDLRQMEDMIASILDMARDTHQAGGRVGLDLRSVLEEVVAQAREVEADAAFEDAAEDADDLVVDGDPLALQRLFGNLIDNGVKYGDHVRVRLARDGEQAIVTVLDQGPGLPGPELERVFEPFYRAPGQTQGGIGLGLAVARQIAREHGGDVLLANAATGGLRVTVRLPLRSVRQPS
jgi:two-component system OmpR family sensor kinase